ncbi:PASTA domain-containing protein [Cellulomonas wangsupingiae]|uniref:PASTA domain-containing protein n=2 Tax=Cellulomonas wangsupingiae TaxID=2968085 RepID=A0ABY5K8C1_9CELL|nr:PASTA domain-containing protein [Cellulomonas wangsupingiae]MCM0638750.1 PASTA domain-containing protein [Cellulomonas wangsupingiae]UUI65377.1 PASTA domain-containing protein [Cellulomonas wangsupingiae]
MIGTLLLAMITACGGPGEAPTAAPTPTPTVDMKAVPDVVGMSLDDAKQALEGAGFDVVSSGEGSAVSVQDPAAGARVREGYAVLVTLEMSADERAAAQAAEAEREAATAALIAEAAAAQREAQLCGPYRTAIGDPRFSAAELAYNAVTSGQVHLPSSVTLVPMGEFVAACPEFSGMFTDMQTRVDAGQVFDSGTYEVGTDIPVGTYKTTGTDIKDCYWSRTTGGGEIIDNDFIGYAPAGVTIDVRAGEGLEVSAACGLWTQQ